MAKILILIGAHLCTAPRPQKEAATLAAAGHEVTVSGVWYEPSLVARDRAMMPTLSYRLEPVLNFCPGQSQAWERAGVRLQARLAREWFKRSRRFSPALLGYGAKAMLRYALREKADLTIVHSEAGLWVGAELLKRGYQVGVDFEDWFSQDLLPSALVTRPVEQLQHLEQTLAQACTYSLTTSQAMADAIAAAYQAPPPTVIYNTFPRADGVNPQGKRTGDRPLSLHWFSHTIGRGRGLEVLFSALPLLGDADLEVHLRGNYPPSSQAWMEPLIPESWRSRLFVHPTVSNAELPLQIAKHDIGLALETPYCSNRQYTVTNKLFQYLQAGLAVIATDTVGQVEVLRQVPDAGTLIPCDDAPALAQAIATYLDSPAGLHQAQQAAYQAGQAPFCWESQTERLYKTLDRALAETSSVPIPPTPSRV